MGFLICSASKTLCETHARDPCSLYGTLKCVCVSVCKSMQVLTRVGIINKVILINIDTYVCYTIHAVP